MQTQISTLAVKDNFLVAGGFQGELTCKVCFSSHWDIDPSVIWSKCLKQREKA